MYLFVKFCGQRFYRKGDINSYINSYKDNLEKAELTASIPPYCEIFKIRNTDLQFRSPGYGWQRNNKKKNTGNCKASYVSCKHKSKHHTSICDKSVDSKSKPVLVTTENNVTYPIAIFKLHSVKCREHF